MSIFFLLSLSTSVKTSKTISLPYYYESNIPCIVINFTTFDKSLCVSINTNNTFYFYHRGLFGSLGKGVKPLKEEMIYKNKNYNSYQYTSDIIINKYHIKGFVFYLFEDSSFYTSDVGIGLRYSDFPNEPYSLIHLLYLNQFIDNLQFAFEPNISNYNGTFHLGGIPNMMDKKYKFNGTCDLEKNQNSWGCNLTSIEYQGNKYPINKYCLFHTGYSQMMFSKYIMSFMMEIVFSDFINKGICYLDNNLYSTKSLKCKETAFIKNEYIHFNFGKMKIEIILRNLFEKDYKEKTYRSKFTYYTNKDNFIILGVDFIKEFNLSVFDYEKKMITLYSDNYPITSNINQQLNNSVLFIITIFLLIITMIFLIYIKLTIKTNVF